MALKILLVTNNYRPYTSGVANALDTLHQQLCALGHEAYIITLDFLGKQEKDARIIRINSPIRFTYKKNPMAVPLRPYRDMQKIIKTIDPDIIHVHHPFLLGNIALKIAQQNNLPIVFTYHTQYEHYAHYVPLPKIMTHSCIKRMVKKFCLSVDGIIAPSESIQKHLAHQRIATPVAVIPSAINDVFFSQKPKELLKKPFQLLTISRLVKEKNIEFLVRVIQKLPDDLFQLTIAGYGAYEEYLKRYAFQQLRLSPQKVRFVTSPSQDQLVNLYYASDAFIFASTTETQGLVLAEAMAAGNPVIALNAPGSSDIVQHNYNGFLIHNEDEMVAAILSLVKDQSLYSLLSVNALQTAQRYRAVELAKEVEQFYINCFL